MAANYTRYYIVAVDDDGDVLATPARLLDRDGLDIIVRTTVPDRRHFAFENQGDDGEAKWEAAKDALAAVMPDDED
jgi:hypothetical protein